jgi:type VI secretion system Hcp family effector
MAEIVHLYLKINGKDIPGEPTQKTEERSGSIECHSVENYELEVDLIEGMEEAVDPGPLQYIKLTKRFDRTSPVFAQAYHEYQELEGIFNFYRHSPTGDESLEHYFDIDFKGGFVESITRISPHVDDPDATENEPYEEIGIIVDDITWRYVPSDVAYHFVDEDD